MQSGNSDDEAGCTGTAPQTTQTPQATSTKQTRPASRTLPLGLAPASALDWLDLQDAFALTPEAIGDLVRAHVSPRAILSRLRSQLDLLPPERRRADEESMRSRRTGELERLGIRVLPLTDPAYPRPLAALTDAPPVLLVRGRVSTLSEQGIAIVGARAATHAARTTARRLARELAAVGFSIVSGLARGIDAEAHRGALDVDGRSVGVLACGPDQIYPPEHRELAEEIIGSGAVISEMPLGVPPRRYHFPLRNRIISGLCRAVIVVEARRRSGSLITVRHALNQGRDVFVVPGSIEGPFAEGTNQLLRDGARPIRCARDVIEDLGIDGGLDLEPPNPVRRATEQHASSDSLKNRVLALLADGPATRDELLLRTELDASGLAAALLELELTGRIVEELDGRFHAIWG
jgi:DNA processing protein